MTIRCIVRMKNVNKVLRRALYCFEDDYDDTITANYIAKYIFKLYKSK